MGSGDGAVPSARGPPARLKARRHARSGAEARTHAFLWRNSHATLCAQVPTHLWEPTLLTGGLAAVVTIGLSVGLWLGGIKLWGKPGAGWLG